MSAVPSDKKRIIEKRSHRAGQNASDRAKLNADLATRKTDHPAVRQRRALRRSKLISLGFDDYSAYLRSPHWLSTRAAYWESDQPKECICGELTGLQLHHMTYERVGAELLSDLTPLCGSCHTMIHVLERRGEMGLDLTGFVNQRRAWANRQVRAEREASIRAERASLPTPSITAIPRVLLDTFRRDGAIAGVDLSTDIGAIERRLDAIDRKTSYAARWPAER